MDLNPNADKGFFLAKSPSDISMFCMMYSMSVGKYNPKSNKELFQTQFLAPKTGRGIDKSCEMFWMNEAGPA